MDSFEVHIDKNKLWSAINDASGTPRVIGDATSNITSAANALSAGFRTKLYYDKKKKKRVGNTQPRYVGDVERRKRSIVGIVHPKNYAAMKDNYLHNTLLKSVRKG